MGFAMARNIARSGIGARAWNRTRARTEPLRADGAHIAATPAEAADGVGIVLTMLADADADADAVVTAMEYDHGALPVMGGQRPAGRARLAADEHHRRGRHRLVCRPGRALWRRPRRRAGARYP